MYTLQHILPRAVVRSTCGALRCQSSVHKKVFPSAENAVADIASGSRILVGGFGLSGVPENLITGIVKKGSDDLHVVSSNVGTAERGLGLLFQTKQISKVTGAYGECACNAFAANSDAFSKLLHSLQLVRMISSSHSSLTARSTWS